MKNSVNKLVSKEDLIVSSLYVLITIIILRLLLLQPGVIGYRSDWIFPPYNAQYRDIGNILYAWNDTLSRPVSLNSVYLFNLILRILSLFSLNGEIISKVGCTFFLFCSGFSIYYLMRSFRVNTLASFIAGFFYMTTPIVFNQFRIGHATELFSYAISPLFIGVFIKFSKNKFDLKKIFILGFLFALTWVQFQYALMNFTLISVYALFLGGKKGLLHLLGTTTFAILVHLPWILVSLTSFMANSTINLGELSTIEYLKHMSPSFFDAIRLKGQVPIPDTFNRMLKSGAIPLSLYNSVSFLIPLIVFLAILAKPKDKRVIFFGSIALFSLIFATGVKPPFGFIFAWLYNKTSLMNLFREVYHLMYIPALAYSILLAFFIQSIMQKVGKQKVTKSFVCLAALGLIVISSWPIFTGDFKGTVQSYQPDKDHKNTYDYLSKLSEDCKVAWLPIKSNLLYKDSKFFDTTRDPMIVFSPKPTIDAATRTFDPYLAFLHRTIETRRTRYLAELLGLEGVKYIVARNDVGSRSSQIWKQNKFLEGQEDLKSIKEFGGTSILLNENTKPLVYGVNEPVIIAGDISTIISLQYYADFKNREIGAFFLKSQNQNSLLDDKIKTVVFGKNGYHDYLFSNTPEYTHNPGSFVKDWYPRFGWSRIFMNWGINWYQVVLPQSGVITQTPSILKVSFRTREGEQYLIFAEIYYGEDASEVKFEVQDFYKRVETKRYDSEGIEWIYIGTITAQKGNSTMSVSSSSGINILGRIVIIPKEIFEQKKQQLKYKLQGKNIILLSEFEETARPHLRTTNKYGVNASGGRTIESLTRNNIESFIVSPISSTYAFYVRLNGVTPIHKISVNGKVGYFKGVTRFSNTRENNDLTWYDLGNVELREGNNDLCILSDPLDMDLLAFDTDNKTSDQEPHEAAKVTFQKINPTRYKVHVDVSQPFFLILNESYHPQWKAYINEKNNVTNWFGVFYNKPISSDSHFFVNGRTNAWYVDRTGSYTIILYFWPQSLLQLGTVILVITLTGCVVYIVYNLKMKNDKTS